VNELQKELEQMKKKDDKKETRIKNLGEQLQK
jgi:hypothetical protein